MPSPSKSTWKFSVALKYKWQSTTAMRPVRTASPDKTTLEHYLLTDDTYIDMFTVDRMKAQLIRRQTVSNIVGCDCVSPVRRSWSQWVECDASWSMWHISNILAVPVFLGQSLVRVRRLRVQQSQTADSHSFIVLNADVSAIIWHHTLVCVQHRCTWTFWTTNH